MGGLPRVQILDPATGTGTFLAEVIKQIAPKIKGIAPGMWSKYIEDDLIPRIHGFELLMASYAMCHMKLDMMLTEMGYKPTNQPPRLGVYLTNSLEEGQAVDQTLPFAGWLSNESKEANTIKRDMPIMCVIGNPPYSGESSNKGDWIMSLMEAYKKEPGGEEKLKERNPKWINDDYVKFIRFAESMIEKNGDGVLAFITNHGYLDNPTFRGMRWHLLKTFDKIYVLDLHGNSKKKEVAPDGSADKNVFDIMQGVAIIIGVKTTPTASKSKPKLAKVFHSDLWGKRAGKYEALWSGGLKKTKWTTLKLHSRYLMFYPIDNRLLDKYDAGFDLSKLMPTNQIGFQSHRDHFAIAFKKSTLLQRLTDMSDTRLSDTFLCEKYTLEDNRDWQVSRARTRLAKLENLENRITKCSYRPFDDRFCLLDETIMDYPRWPIMRNCVQAQNIALNFVRQTKMGFWQHSIVSKHPTPAVFVEIKDGSNFAPLYLYPDEQDLDQSRRVNFDRVIWGRIVDAVVGGGSPPSCGEGLGVGASEAGTGGNGGNNGGNEKPPTGSLRSPTSPQGGGKKTPSEVAIFDYIYGVLHCPAYRETYKEFLKIDFPRIPYPSSPDAFWDISAKGTALRQLHLMEDEAIGQAPYPFDGPQNSDDANVVEKPKFVETSDGMGAVFINKTHSFSDVPKIAWEFYIGGYQPAQKWLKDRKGRELSFDDVRHYQKIIKILSETDRIMKTIEMDL